jgi:hypothetical protein
LEDWKIKIAVLWFFWTVAFLIHISMAFFEDADLVIEPKNLFPTAIIMLVPLVMAFMSLTLKDLINRWANVVLGIIYTGFWLFIWMRFVPPQPDYSILMFISEIVASALVVWYAWKSKKKA